MTRRFTRDRAAVKAIRTTGMIFSLTLPSGFRFVFAAARERDEEELTDTARYENVPT